MERRPLGATGLTVSALGFGCGNGGGLLIRGSRRDQLAVVARAIEAGVSYFDTAPSYGDGASETNLGAVLRALGASQRVMVGTKVRVGPDEPGVAVRRSLEGSLQRLGLERVDLLQLHDRLGGDAGLAGGRLLAVAEAMRSLRDEGLAGAIGCTALGEPGEIDHSIESAPFETAQCYVNAVNPSAVAAGHAGGGQDFAGLIDRAAARGLGVLAIRVFAAGALAGDAPRPAVAGPPGGRPLAGSDFAADARRAARLESVGRRLGLESILELSLRFVLGLDGVSTALLGFSDLSQLEAALRWSSRGRLPADAVERVLDLSTAAPDG